MRGSSRILEGAGSARGFIAVLAASVPVTASGMIGELSMATGSVVVPSTKVCMPTDPLAGR
jgi:hypothetical protein